MLWFQVLIRTRRGLIQDVIAPVQTRMAECAIQEWRKAPIRIARFRHSFKQITAETTTESDGRVGSAPRERPDDPPQPPPMTISAASDLRRLAPDERLSARSRQEEVCPADIAKQVPQYVDHHLSKARCADWRSGVSEMDAGCQGVWAIIGGMRDNHGRAQEREGVQPKRTKISGLALSSFRAHKRPVIGQHRRKATMRPLISPELRHEQRKLAAANEAV